jgi:hypothetical protein
MNNKLGLPSQCSSLCRDFSRSDLTLKQRQSLQKIFPIHFIHLFIYLFSFGCFRHCYCCRLGYTKDWRAYNDSPSFADCRNELILNTETSTRLECVEPDSASSSNVEKENERERPAYRRGKTHITNNVTSSAEHLSVHLKEQENS